MWEVNDETDFLALLPLLIVASLLYGLYVLAWIWAFDTWNSLPWPTRLVMLPVFGVLVMVLLAILRSAIGVRAW